jgi:hypothetical protein
VCIREREKEREMYGISSVICFVSICVLLVKAKDTRGLSKIESYKAY